jgi:hypothetical protein
MALAGFIVRHPAELRADFQQYYGLNIDGMGQEFDVFHAADLAAQLPSDSRTFKAENVELEWTDSDYMLWSIEFSLRVLRWQNTEDGRKNRNKPRPLPTPAEHARIADKINSTDMALIAEQLGIDIDMEGA